QFQMDECHKLLTDKVDLVNPEGHQILHNVYEPLPLGGPLERIFKKKAKNKQNRARNGKDKVKSKSKVNQVKKIQLKGLKLPNLKLYYKRKRQGSKLQTGRSLL
ncbi:hypothetical protein Tco_0301271, partial [Tanacetum coccineum]